MIGGVVSGLSAALCQSLCYLATRHYVQRRGAGASRELLVLAHVWMGIFSLALLPFVWAGGIREVQSVWLPLVLSAVFYLTGQLGLVMALKHAEPSRVSPLLGFKIVVLGAMASFLVQPHPPGTPAPPIGLTWLQWAAVILCVLAALLLNRSGGALRGKAVAAIVIACIGYSLSDWNITILVGQVEGFSSKAIAPFLATGLAYSVSGIIAIFFLPAYGTRETKAWRDAIPFAVLWFVAMLFLFTCFGNVKFGPVLGNILQSTRGLMSIVLGALLACWGYVHIEPASGRGVLVRRLAAGVLMFLAVSLYVIREPETLKLWYEGRQGQGVSHGSGEQDRTTRNAGGNALIASGRGAGR